MSWGDFHFIRPVWLLALIPCVGFIIWSIKNTLSQGEWVDVCDTELLPFILEEKTNSNSNSPWVFSAIALASLLSVIVLAGPAWERLETPAFRNDAALVIALDLSQTMNANDIKPSRLVRARYKIADILKQRKDGLTALVVYAGDAFTVTPLTNDIATIESQLNALDSLLMPQEIRSMKNVESALTLAVQLLQQAGQKQGDIFLITDGIENSASALAKNSSAYEVSILGVGTKDGAPIKLPSGGFLKDSNGNILVPKLQSAKLASFARQAGGIYSNITTNDRDIKNLLSHLDRPVADTANNQSNGLVEQWKDMGGWLLLLVLPLAALGFRRGILMLFVVVMLPMPQTSYAVEWDDLWLNKNQQAQQAFNKGEFKQAGEQFESAEWKAAAHYKAGEFQQAVDELKQLETAESYYNKGNGFAKLGQLDKAKKAYESSLKIDPSNEDAKHNLNEVEQALKKQQPEKDQNNSEQDKDQTQGDKQEKEQQSKQSEGDKQQSDEGENDDAKDDSVKPSDQQNDKESMPPKESPKEEGSKLSDADLDKQASEEEEANEKQQAEMSALSGEQKQASEQWLNRIKDDPAGLLKRKFKYQYGQRHQR